MLHKRSVLFNNADSVLNIVLIFEKENREKKIEQRQDYLLL